MHTIALIGCGGISGADQPPEKAGAAGYGHLLGAHDNPRVKLVAVADTSPERRQVFQTNWGAAFPDVKCYESAAAMFQNESPDVVDVCVRGPAHFPVTMEVMRRLERRVLDRST